MSDNKGENQGQLGLFGNMPKVPVPPKGQSKKATPKGKDLPGTGGTVKIELVDFYAKPAWPWEYVTDPNDLPRIAEDLSKRPLNGLDIETTGVDPHQDRVRLVQLARHGQTYLLDLFRLGTLGPVADVLKGGPIKVGHVLKFETKMLNATQGIEPYPLFCTHTANKLIDRQYSGNTLAEVADNYLGIKMDKTEQASDWSAPELSERQLDYAALDAEAPVKLYQPMADALLADGLGHIAQLEFDLIHPVAALETAGIKIDVERWRKNADELEQEANQLEAQLKQLLHEEGFPGAARFNARSPQQVMEALHAVGPQVKSTREETLKKYRMRYPFVDVLLKYREVHKKVSSWGHKYLEHLNEHTHRFHPKFDPLGAASGRYSCSSPNLQQIPHTAFWRGCFIAEDGYLILVADYSQIELRVAAAIARDQDMLEAYKAGIDIHRLTAATVYGGRVEAVTKDQRQAAKAINFGLIYGMSAEGLKHYARSSYGVILSDAEARQFRSRYFQRYGGIKRWHEEQKIELESGRMREIRTLGGRVRKWTPDKVPWLGIILNTPVQGTAADGMKQSQVILHKRLKAAGYGDGARVVNLVHDEIVMEVRKDLIGEVSPLLCQSMVDGMKVYIKDVPIEVEPLVGDSWAAK